MRKSKHRGKGFKKFRPRPQFGGANVFKQIKNKWNRLPPKTKKIIKGVAGAAGGLAALYGASRGVRSYRNRQQPYQSTSDFDFGLDVEPLWSEP